MLKMIMKVVLLLCSMSLISTMKTIPSKEDCIALWNAVGGAGGESYEPYMISHFILCMICIVIQLILSHLTDLTNY